MIKGEPRFGFLREDADQRDALLDDVKASHPDVLARVRQKTGEGFDHKVRQSLRDELERIGNEMLGAAATQLRAVLTMAPQELTLLRALAQRDLAMQWTVPDWRAHLSYRQLVQTRIWTRLLTTASAAPFATQACAIESIFQAVAAQAIARKLAPWRVETAGNLAALAATLRPRGRGHALAAAVLYERLWAFLEEVAIDTYDGLTSSVSSEGG